MRLLKLRDIQTFAQDQSAEDVHSQDVKCKAPSRFITLSIITLQTLINLNSSVTADAFTQNKFFLYLFIYFEPKLTSNSPSSTLASRTLGSYTCDTIPSFMQVFVFFQLKYIEVAALRFPAFSLLVRMPLSV